MRGTQNAAYFSLAFGLTVRDRGTNPLQVRIAVQQRVEKFLARKWLENLRQCVSGVKDRKHGTVGQLRVSLSKIVGQNRIRVNRSRACRDAVGGPAGYQFFRHLSFFYPVFQSAECIEVRESRSSPAVMNSRNQE